MGREPAGPGRRGVPARAPGSRRPAPRGCWPPPRAHAPLPQPHSPAPSAPTARTQFPRGSWPAQRARTYREGTAAEGGYIRPALGPRRVRSRVRNRGPPAHSGAPHSSSSGSAGRAGGRRGTAQPRPPAATWGAGGSRGRSLRWGSRERPRPLLPGGLGRRGNLPASINTRPASAAARLVPGPASVAVRGPGWRWGVRHTERGRGGGVLGNIWKWSPRLSPHCPPPPWAPLLLLPPQTPCRSTHCAPSGSPPWARRSHVLTPEAPSWETGLPGLPGWRVSRSTGPDGVDPFQQCSLIPSRDGVWVVSGQPGPCWVVQAAGLRVLHG